MNHNDNYLGEAPTPLIGSRVTDCWQRGDLTHQQQDWVAEEVPIALVYNGISHVVMMATPKDLEAFALGFSLSEGIADVRQDILGIDVEHYPQGIEVNIELSSRRFNQLKARRRNLAGRTGCGICGIEQLNEIARPLPTLPSTQVFSLKDIDGAISRMREYQPIGMLTGCTHVALWLDNHGDILQGCEDIGRHVALDKLLGVRSQRGWQQGVLLVSSRASYEMVQKAVMCGVEIMFAVSAVSALAIDIARRSHLTLVGFSRQGKATLYTHPERLYP